MCGKCAADQVCTDEGKCCTPQCEGKECGPDGCGGTCGTCQDGQKCVVDQCVWPCSGSALWRCCYKNTAVSCGNGWLTVQDCSDRVCAWDFNAYSCVDSIDEKESFEEDPSGEFPRKCDFTCHPNCYQKQCGTDGCGGSCGKCAEGLVCFNSRCCLPHCEGKNCGPDGCGGSCGEYSACEQCISHHCKAINGCVVSEPGPEPVPDRAEDVTDASKPVPDVADSAAPDQAKSDVPVKDPGAIDARPGKDTPDNQSTKDKTAPADAVQSDTGPSNPGSGGCTTTGTGNAPYWVLLIFTSLLYLRRRA